MIDFYKKIEKKIKIYIINYNKYKLKKIYISRYLTINKNNKLKNWNKKLNI